MAGKSLLKYFKILRLQIFKFVVPERFSADMTATVGSRSPCLILPVAPLFDREEFVTDSTPQGSYVRFGAIKISTFGEKRSNVLKG